MAGRDNLQGETLRFAGEDRYLLERRIGEGGFGDVYQALDLKLRQHRAIKTVDRSYASQVKRETIVGNQIQSQHIVNYIDFESDSDPPYLVMEFLRGPDLHTLLQMGKVYGELLLRLVDDVADALQCLHQQHVIHRDLKPRNIKLVDESQRNERFVILDFGIASQRDAGETMRGATWDGAGTLEYMAPEQFGNEEPTGQADIYAFGVILFRILTGQVPMRFQHTNATSYLRDRAELDSPRFHDILQRDLTEFEADVENIVLKCLDRDPDKRPTLVQIVEEFHSAFETTDARIGRPPAVADLESRPTVSGQQPVGDAGAAPHAATIRPEPNPPQKAERHPTSPPAVAASETMLPQAADGPSDQTTHGGPSDQTALPAGRQPGGRRAPSPIGQPPQTADQTLAPPARKSVVPSEPAAPRAPVPASPAAPLNFDQTQLPGGGAPAADPRVAGSHDPVAADSDAAPPGPADDDDGLTRLFSPPASPHKPRQLAKLAISLLLTAVILGGGAGYLLLNRQNEQIRQRIGEAVDGDRYDDALDALRDLHFIQRWWLDSESEQRNLSDLGLRRVESLTTDGELRRALTLCDELERAFKSVPGIDLGPLCDQLRSRIRSSLLEEFDRRLEQDAYQESLEFVQTQADLLIQFETNLPVELRERTKRRGLATAGDTQDPAQSYRLLKDSLLSLFPDDPDVIRMLWEVELEYAKALNAQGKYSEALSFCRDAESRGAPARALLEPLCTALNGRAAAAKWPEAHSDYQEALTRLDAYRDHPLWATTLLNQAASRRATEPQQAVCDCGRILEQHPQHPQAIELLGEMFDAFQEMAIKQFRTARLTAVDSGQRSQLQTIVTAGISAWELVSKAKGALPRPAPLELHFVRATLGWESARPPVETVITDLEQVDKLAAQRRLKSLSALARLRMAWIRATHVHFQDRRPQAAVMEGILSDIEEDYYSLVDNNVGDRDLSWLTTLFLVTVPKPKDREYQLGVFLVDSFRTQAAILGANGQFKPARLAIETSLGQLKTLDQRDQTSVAGQIEELQRKLQDELQGYTQEQPVIDARQTGTATAPCPLRKPDTSQPVQPTDDPTPGV